MEPVLLGNIEIEIREVELLKILGSMGRAESWKGKGIEEKIERVLDRASNLIEPRGIYVITEGRKLGGTDIFNSLEKMAFSVCTIGERLEKEVGLLSRQDSILEAVLLDSAGSVAAEEVANYIENKIAEIATGEGKKISPRASPGYGEWKIANQRNLFELLPADRIGVTLASSMMMSPRKSISFAIHISETPVRLRGKNFLEKL
ncbi:hypothetical protein J7M07_06780 [bacterium]|nr:hypothetical protein [bacterium]